MGSVKLLDCTLRDGGYVNDWLFGRNNLVGIFERLADAEVDIIEVGFLDERREFDIDRSIMPDTDSAGKIYGKLDRKKSLIVAMIDFGTCGIKNIKPRSESCLDGIRVIFKKHLREPAMMFCAELKKLGYLVFAQLVSVTSYSDGEMLDLIRLANNIKPYAVSMVDTYGLMHSDNLMHYFEMLDSGLSPEITLGYHGHNNFQMGYANCIAMLSVASDRDRIVDGSLYGMGKSAGNAPVELIALHINNVFGKRYRISQLLEAIDSNISQFYRPATWGYNMLYFIAASNDCHPEYVKYLTNKHTLSIKSINEILGRLDGEKKLLFDRELIESLYLDFQVREVDDDDLKKLSLLFSGRKILLIGPGNTVADGRDAILNCIAENKPVIISINHIPRIIEPDYIFVSNSKRYSQLANAFAQSGHSVIATSNITPTGSDGFDFVLNYGTLIDSTTKIPDNSLVMLLKVLMKTSVSRVYLAGFDGYSPDASNYFDAGMEYEFVRDMADYLNNYTRDFLGSVCGKLGISFLTESRYNLP